MNMDVLFCHIRCLSDSKRMGAKSLFLQRSQEDKLQFQLKAFRFHQDQPGNSSVRSNLCVIGLKKKKEKASYVFFLAEMISIQL